MIGVFDSGFGGLHVLRGIINHLPEYDYIYLGDSHRAPYGDRPQAEVLEFTKQAVDFLFKQGAVLVILACNTASSEALREIQRTSHKKVLGVLVPLAEAAVAKSHTKRIGVIATRGTVRSSAFAREITKIDPAAWVVQQACPRLVSLVENGEQDTPLAHEFIKEYLHVPLEQHIDTLVLGCTHYGILEPMIREVIGSGIEIVSGREVIPVKFKEYLSRHPELESTLSKNGRMQFYSTGTVKVFNELGSHFFGTPVNAQFATLSTVQ
jgi:glutamate racemase